MWSRGEGGGGGSGDVCMYICTNAHFSLPLLISGDFFSTDLQKCWIKSSFQ